MTMVTHFCQFTDEATAQSQLAAYGSTDPISGNWNWRGDIVDAGVPVHEPITQYTTDQITGAQIPVITPKSGYFLNIALPVLNAALPGLTGAGYRDPVTKAWVTVYGAQPAGQPQREFAS